MLIADVSEPSVISIFIGMKIKKYVTVQTVLLFSLYYLHYLISSVG